MIRPILLSEIDNIKPLLEEFYLEQKAYKEVFDWNYIYNNLYTIISSSIYNNSYLILTDDIYSCIFIAHISTNLLLPIREAYEDYIFITTKARGSATFLRLMLKYEAWCIENDIKYINAGEGTRIMTDKVKDLYTRFGYSQYYSGFKKELN
jgi:hypothetical protein